MRSRDLAAPGGTPQFQSRQTISDDGKTITREFIPKGGYEQRRYEIWRSSEPTQFVTENGRGIRVGIPVSPYDIQVEKLPTALQFFLHI